MTNSKADQSHRPAALVTGGARRVGRAIAIALARAGCDVAVHYNKSEDDARTAGSEIESSGGRAALIRGDLLDPAMHEHIIADTVDRLGRLDILINNASVFHDQKPDTIEALDEAVWEAMFRVNVTAPAALAHHAAAHLRRSGRGAIVNLLDAALDRPWRRHIAYQASKAALANLTRTLAKALAPDIRVNGVAPGIAVFPESYDAATRERLVRRVPLGRAGTPEDIAEAVCFLASGGPYVTGEIIRVDGGRAID